MKEVLPLKQLRECSNYLRTKVAAFSFRLQYLLDQKTRVKEAAERYMTERRWELAAEKETLNVIQRELESLAQTLLNARLEMLYLNTAFAENLLRRAEHLRGLAHEREAIHESLCAQQLVIEEAEVKLGHAREHLILCSREVEILAKFRDKLQQSFLQAAARKDEMEQDEIGNISYLVRSRTR
jgi:hypothetical protein